jgi:hypothetical protein
MAGTERISDMSLLKLTSLVSSSSPSKGAEYATQSVVTMGDSSMGEAAKAALKPPARVGVVGGEGIPESPIR